MKLNAILVPVVAIGTLAACNNAGNDNNTANLKDVNNPFFTKSTLQYQAPEFDKIKTEHFKPAFDSGMVQQNAELEKIVANTEAPTFANTILPLETSGEILKRAQLVFFNFTSANTNDDIQKLEEEYAPKFSAHNDGIYLNDKLFQRVKAIYNSRDSIKDAEDKKLVEFYFENFEMAGANLSDADKDKLKKLNEQEAGLIANYTSKLLAARKDAAVIFDKAEELDGLNAEELKAAQSDAEAAGQKGKYLIALQNYTQHPLLQNLKNRATREKIFKASWTRAERGDKNDTRAIIEQLAKLRLQKAKLLGKPNFAAWTLQDQMAKNPEAAKNLLKQMATPAVAKAKAEAAELQKLIDAEGGNFKLEPWDWNFYAEKLRKAKYDLDEAEMKPYFEVTTVLEKGVFYAAEKLYGVTFKKRTDIPVYHPDVVAYEVFDRDGKSIAIYYLDFYTRDNKSGGAWMSNYVDQSHLLKQQPVITNVYNYQKPAPGSPSLISFDDVETMFHEFGHSIHGLFANQKYVSLSGTAVPRDFVEFPSQINEHWALEPSVLKNYAIHYQTKQPIPQSLLDKMKNAAGFNQGYMATELTAAAALDMAWHTITDESQVKDALSFEENALSELGLLVKEVPTRYHSPYFLHIWGNGYSAAYYAYIWSEVLDQDAYQWFVNNGGMTRENGDRFREFILSIGNTQNLNEAFKKFTGHTADIKPLLRSKGFIQ
ncbi:M3 family metallopeptidase [Polluticaenibacter yanchengensis]|uniref:M3 family metallopeptidase n=1 Tax=Polluticaenibacter yanchengensis TaxID=3014562 RepID=A0ABT4UJ55_9BACT|nr:M3 family metallopeptidase [Chitinophagaceae bacterium LY-5]